MARSTQAACQHDRTLPSTENSRPTAASRRQGWRGTTPGSACSVPSSCSSECSKKELGQILTVAKEIDFDAGENICVQGKPSGAST